MSVTADRVEATSGEHLDVAGRLSGDLTSLDDFTQELGGPPHGDLLNGDAAGLLSRRINANPKTVEKDLAKLVLALIDLVRRLMERQAARRVNSGSLSDDQIERMGETFLALDRRMAELRTSFGLTNEDMNLSLGPLCHPEPLGRSCAIEDKLHEGSAL